MIEAMDLMSGDGATDMSTKSTSALHILRQLVQAAHWLTVADDHDSHWTERSGMDANASGSTLVRRLATVLLQACRLDLISQPVPRCWPTYFFPHERIPPAQDIFAGTDLGPDYTDADLHIWRCTYQYRRTDYMRRILRALTPMVALDVLACVCEVLRDAVVAFDDLDGLDNDDGSHPTAVVPLALRQATLVLLSQWVLIAPCRLIDMVTELLQWSAFTCPLTNTYTREEHRLVLIEATFCLMEQYRKRDQPDIVLLCMDWTPVFVWWETWDRIGHDTNSVNVEPTYANDSNTPQGRNFDALHATRWFSVRVAAHLLNASEGSMELYCQRRNLGDVWPNFVLHPWFWRAEQDDYASLSDTRRTRLWNDVVSTVDAVQIRQAVPLHAYLADVAPGYTFPKQHFLADRDAESHSPSTPSTSLVLTATAVENLQRIATAMTQQLELPSVLLCGPQGAGKSTLLRNVATLMNATLLELHVDDETDAKTLIGNYTTTETPGKFEWRPGALTKAVRSGHWVVWDDMDTVSRDLQAALMQLFKERHLPLGNGERERCHPNFRLFATLAGDISKCGTKLDHHVLFPLHWCQVQIEPLRNAELVEIGTKTYPGIPCAVIDALVSIFSMLTGVDDEIATHVDAGSKSSWSLRSLRYTPERTTTIRELFKVFARVAIIPFEPQMSYATEGQRMLCLVEVTDVFAGSWPNIDERRQFVRCIAAPRLGLSGDLATAYLERRVPDIVNHQLVTEIGRSRLPSNVSHPAWTRIENDTFTNTSSTLRMLEAVAVAVQMKEPVLLTGETGTGKTTLLQQLAKMSNNELVVQNLSLQTDSTDLLGGHRPLDLSAVARKVYDSFVDLFVSTFSRKQNAEFLEYASKALRDESWERLSQCFSRAAKLGLKKTDQAFMGKKQAWQAFIAEADSFEHQRVACESGPVFSFVEGALVDAIKNGKWILFDEINLASSETLQRLSGLVDNAKQSLVLTERGDHGAMSRSSSFRFFGAMNPATDVGKKDLAPNFRSRLTEFFVPEMTDPVELRHLAADYLIGAVSVPKTQPEGDDIVLQLVDAYVECRRLAEQVLCNSAGHRPRYTLRTLSRALVAARSLASSQKFCMKRSLLEGFQLAFVGALDEKSKTTINHQLKLAISDASNDDKYPGKCPGKEQDFTLLKPFWLRRGPVGGTSGSEPTVSKDFVLTPSANNNMRMLSRAISSGPWPILLEGPTSGGKTSLIKHVADKLGYKVVRINNHEHTDIQEYIGSFVADDKGSLGYRDGLLVTALRHGHWVILDELNLAPTEVLEALNRLLDDNRELFVADTGESVKAHQNFRLFATQNPAGAYGGRKPLSRAFRNRFVEISVDDIPPTELETIIEVRCGRAPSQAKALVDVMIELRRHRSAGRLFQGRDSLVTPRDLLKWGLRNATSKLDLARQGYMILAERIRSADEKNIIQDAIERRFKVRLDMESFYYGNSSKVKSMFKLAEDFTQREPFSTLRLAPTRSILRLLSLVSQAIETNEPVLLVGETGCGKTSAIQWLSAMYESELRVVNCHATTDASDLLGSMRPARTVAIDAQLRGALFGLFDALPQSSPFKLSQASYQDSAALLELAEEICGHNRREDDHFQQGKKRRKVENMARALVDAGNHEKIDEVRALMVRRKLLFEWYDGPLTEAMKEGKWLLLDEMSLADDAVLERLNSVFESERVLVLAEMPDSTENYTVVAQHGFQVFATMNPGGDFGKRELSPALRSRFTEIWVPQITNCSEIETVVCQQLRSDMPERAAIASAMRQYAAMYNDMVDATFGATSALRLSLRDIRTWADFMEVVITSHGNVMPWEAYYHGAYLMHLDGIEVGSPTTANYLRSLCRLARTILIGQVPAGARIFPVGRTSGCVLDVLDTSTSKHGVKNFEFDTPSARACVIKLLRALHTPKAILLEGPPGAGKSSIVSALANATGQKLVRLNLSEQTDVSDLFGQELPTVSHESSKSCRNANFSWSNGLLLQAMVEGEWILLDELNLASQSVLEGLNSCLDHRGSVFIPELGQTFLRSPSFRIFATQNPYAEGDGRKGLPRSFLNRFTRIRVNDMTYNDFMHIASNSLAGIDKKFRQQLVTYTKFLSESSNNGDRCRTGRPWNFNMREILRCCCNFARCSVENALFDTFAARFRCRDDQTWAENVSKRVFGTVGINWSLRRSSLMNDLLALNEPSSDPVKVCCGHNHHIFARSMDALSSVHNALCRGLSVVLVGASPSGKTSIARLCAAACNRELVELSLSATSDVTELVGAYKQVDKESRTRSMGVSLLDIAGRVLSHCEVSSETFTTRHELARMLSNPEFDIERVEKHCTALGQALIDSERLGASTAVKVKHLIAGASNNNDVVHFVWEDGPLVKAVRDGQWIFLANANFCPAAVLDRLNALLETDGVLVLTERGRDCCSRVRPHDSFRLILSLDPSHGEISRAMRNRCVEVYLHSERDERLLSSDTASQRSGKQSLHYPKSTLFCETLKRMVSGTKGLTVETVWRRNEEHLCTPTCPTSVPFPTTSEVASRWKSLIAARYAIELVLTQPNVINRVLADKNMYFCISGAAWFASTTIGRANNVAWGIGARQLAARLRHRVAASNVLVSEHDGIEQSILSASVRLASGLLDDTSMPHGSSTRHFLPLLESLDCCIGDATSNDLLVDHLPLLACTELVDGFWEILENSPASDIGDEGRMALSHPAMRAYYFDLRRSLSMLSNYFSWRTEAVESVLLSVDRALLGRAYEELDTADYMLRAVRVTLIPQTASEWTELKNFRDKCRFAPWEWHGATSVTATDQRVHDDPSLLAGVPTELISNLTEAFSLVYAKATGLTDEKPQLENFDVLAASLQVVRPPQDIFNTDQTTDERLVFSLNDGFVLTAVSATNRCLGQFSLLKKLWYRDLTEDDISRATLQLISRVASTAMADAICRAALSIDALNAFQLLVWVSDAAVNGSGPYLSTLDRVMRFAEYAFARERLTSLNSLHFFDFNRSSEGKDDNCAPKPRFELFSDTTCELSSRLISRAILPVESRGFSSIRNYALRLDQVGNMLCDMASEGDIETSQYSEHEVVVKAAETFCLLFGGAAKRDTVEKEQFGRFVTTRERLTYLAETALQYPCDNAIDEAIRRTAECLIRWLTDPTTPGELPAIKVFLGLLRFHVFRPSTLIDPSILTSTRLERMTDTLHRWRDEEECIRYDQATSQRHFLWDDEYLVSLRNSAKNVLREKAEMEPNVIQRPATPATFDDLHASLNGMHCQHMSPVVISELVASASSGDTLRLQYWRENINALCKHLVQHFWSFEDIVSSIIDAISMIKEGLGELEQSADKMKKPCSVLRLAAYHCSSFPSAAVLDRLLAFRDVVLRDSELIPCGSKRTAALIHLADIRRCAAIFGKDSHYALAWLSTLRTLMDEMDGSQNNVREGGKVAIRDEDDLADGTKTDELVWSFLDLVNWQLPQKGLCGDVEIAMAFAARYRMMAVCGRQEPENNADLSQCYLRAGHCLALAMQVVNVDDLYSARLLKSLYTSPTGDFFSDPAPQATVLAKDPLDVLFRRVQDLRVIFSENEVLRNIENEIDCVYALGTATASKGTALRALEKLLRVAQVWEQHASVKFKFGVELLSISDLVLQWRKDEIASWPSLLDARERQCKSRCRRRLWPHLLRTLGSLDTSEPFTFNAPTIVPLLVVKDLQWSNLKVRPVRPNNEHDEIVEALDTFLLTSTVGDFTSRLDMLSVLIDTLTYASVRSNDLLNVATSLRGYYEQYVHAIQEHLKSSRAPFENKLSDEAKFSRWEDTTYYALAESTERSHRRIVQIVKEYEESLQFPVQELLRNFQVNSRTLGDSQIVKDGEKFARTTLPGGLQDGERLRNEVQNRRWCDVSIFDVPADNFAAGIPRYCLLMDEYASEMRAAVSEGIHSDVACFSDAILRRFEDVRRPGKGKQVKDRAYRDLLNALRDNGFLRSRIFMQLPFDQFLQVPTVGTVDDLDGGIRSALTNFEAYYFRCAGEVLKFRNESGLGTVRMPSHDVKLMSSIIESGHLASAQQMVCLATMIPAYISLKSAVAQSVPPPSLLQCQTQLRQRIKQFEVATRSLGFAVKELCVLLRTCACAMKGEKHVDWARRTLETIELASQKFVTASYLPEGGHSVLEDNVFSVKVALQNARTFHSRLIEYFDECVQLRALPKDSFVDCVQQTEAVVHLAQECLSVYPVKVTKQSTSEMWSSLFRDAIAASTEAITMMAQVCRKHFLRRGSAEKKTGFFEHHFDCWGLFSAIDFEGVSNAIATVKSLVEAAPDIDGTSQPVREAAREALVDILTLARCALEMVEVELATYAVFCQKFAKLRYILLRIFRSLLNSGFCDDDAGNAEAERDEIDGSGPGTGTGMGQGEGLKDVTDEIENEDQLLGLQEERKSEGKLRSDPLTGSDDKEGMEMTADFEGDMHDLSDKNDPIESSNSAMFGDMENNGADSPLESGIDREMWADGKADKSNDSQNDDSNLEVPESERQFKDGTLHADEKGSTGEQGSDETSGGVGTSRPDEMRNDDSSERMGTMKEDHKPSSQVNDEKVGSSSDTKLHDTADDISLQQDNASDNTIGTGSEAGVPASHNGGVDEDEPGIQDIIPENLQLDSEMHEDDNFNSIQNTDSDSVFGNDFNEAATAGDDVSAFDDNSETLVKDDTHPSFAHESAISGGLGVRDASGSDQVEDAWADDVVDEDITEIVNDSFRGFSEEQGAGANTGESRSSTTRGNRLEIGESDKNEQVRRQMPNPFTSIEDATDYMRKKLAMVGPTAGESVDIDADVNDQADENMSGTYEFTTDETAAMALGDSPEAVADHVQDVRKESPSSSGDRRKSREDLESSNRARRQRPLPECADRAIDNESQDTSEDNEILEDSLMPDEVDATRQQPRELHRVVAETESMHLDDVSSIEKRPELELVQHEQTSGIGSEEMTQARRLWQEITMETHGLSGRLCEKIRLILEPLVASKLRGDYRTGKRINMKRIIGYIASGYRKDKIWLRRTKPAKRNYRVLLAVDDSESMKVSGAGAVALRAMATVVVAMQQLEVGEVGIASFGNEMSLVHPFGPPVTADAGATLVSQFRFDQARTRTTLCIESALDALRSTPGDVASRQLVFLISDGRIERDSRSTLRRVLRDMTEQNIMVAMIIVESPDSESILDLKEVNFVNGRPDVKSFMDEYPFPYYMVLRDMTQLPEVLGDALREWFEMLQQLENLY